MHKVIVPIDVGAEAGVKDYFELMDLLIDKLVDVRSGGAPAK